MTTVDQIRQRLEEFPEISFAYLFGSRVKGTPREDSDWDVAVALSAELTAEERFRLQLRLAADLEELGRLDLVILNDAPPLLAHRAISGQRLLVRDEVALVRFSVRTVAMYADQQPWREAFRRARQQRLQEGTFGRP